MLFKDVFKMKYIHIGAAMHCIGALWMEGDWGGHKCRSLNTLSRWSVACGMWVEIVRFHSTLG